MRILAAQITELSRRVLSSCGGCAVALRRGVFPAVSIGIAAQCSLAYALTAQTPAPVHPQQTTHPAIQHIAHARTPVRHHRSSTAKAAVPPAPVRAPAPVPAAPPPPNWPANDKPTEATVIWDNRGLLIQASNSSLDQILKDVSLRTGAKVQGMGADQRVFGTYGPGPARDVLAQLLDGSGYNILMVGDQGAGTPREIVLSGRPNGPAPPPSNSGAFSNNMNEPDDQQIVQPPFEPNSVQPPAPGMPVRSPQQMEQLMEERQRQIQQQQYNSQDNQN